MSWPVFAELFWTFTIITCREITVKASLRILKDCTELGQVKRKCTFEHAQNTQMQIILRMRKVSSGPWFSIHTLCSIQLGCKRTLKVLIRLQGCVGWPGPSLSAYVRRQAFPHLLDTFKLFAFLMSRYSFLLALCRAIIHEHTIHALICRIRCKYCTYPYKRTIKQFLRLHISAHISSTSIWAETWEKMSSG